MIRIEIENRSNNEIPSYAHPGDSGVDIRAFISEPVELEPFSRHLIPTGIYLRIPEGYEAQVRPRSGLAIRKGITVLNTPGTVDSCYRGEIGVILINMSGNKQIIEPGEKIAQLVFAKVEQAELVEGVVTEDKTVRGDNGYGSSGRF